MKLYALVVASMLLAGCSGDDSGGDASTGGASSGGASSGGANSGGASSGGESSGGASGGTHSGGASSGGSAGSANTGGAAGSANTGGAAGSANTGGAAGSAGSAGAGAACPPSSGADVGPTNPSALKQSASITVTQSNTVIENVEIIDGEITIDNGAENVTIRNFRIKSDGYWGIGVEDGKNVIIEDGEIDGMDAMHDAIRGANYSARRLYIHNVGGDSFKANGNNVVECNYVTKIGQAPGAHGDGIQMMGGGNIDIIKNNFDLTSGELTACIFPGGGSSPITDPINVLGNRLNGGGWVVYCIKSMHVKDNVFGPIFGYGPVTDACGTWSGNTWEKDGTPVSD